MKEIQQKVNRLYPSFSSQLDIFRETYNDIWKYLSMGDYLKILKEFEEDYHNKKVYPEVDKDAVVRQGSDISVEERHFLIARKEKQRKAFAHFIGVNSHEIESEDMPIVGIASSGGGYRAMAGSAGYIKAMKKTGGLDCVMYIAGVSGSCWNMAMYYSPLTHGSCTVLLDHLKSHMHTHLATLSHLLAIMNISRESSIWLTQGAVERYYQQQNTLQLVDIFGMLIGATFLTDKRNCKKNSMKLSQQTKLFADGSQPMPIYCVVRHDTANIEEEENGIYQWFEFTPFEMGCEEINAWVPTWAFGRKFEHGKNIERLPEQTLEIMMGVFGSAFVASIVHVYQEIRGSIPSTAVGTTDEIVARYEKSMSSFHPISPAGFHNPFYHLPKHDDEEGYQWTDTSSLLDSKEIYLMDAGMDNNIPFYPLLRQERKVDVILAIDFSADIQTSTHFERAEGYVRRRGIEGWPQVPKNPSSSLETCAVFSTRAAESVMDTEITSERLRYPVTVIYFPFIENKAHSSEFDPQTSEFCSTLNFAYTEEQIDSVYDLAEANWNENVDKVREVLRTLWRKKREDRLQTRLDIHSPF
ncbi:acyl transferase/acyl hydrolase/lysophospholipase [Spinellus fusiger]|nr:acyl transferase/acyl hydrolase/lysophospholipase [Spinellus fusiger]